MSSADFAFTGGQTVWAIPSPNSDLVNGTILTLEYDSYQKIDGTVGTRKLCHIITEETVVIVEESDVFETQTEAEMALVQRLTAPKPSRTPTPTPRPTRTPRPTSTPTRTPRVTPTRTRTPALTAPITPSITPTISTSATPTLTPGFTPSPTATMPPTPSVTVSPEFTPSPTATLPPTPSVTITPSVGTSTTPTPSSQIGPFDGLYATNFELVSDQTNYTRPAQSKPAKMTNITTPGYTDGVFGTKIFGVTRVTDVADSVTNLRHVYSRQAAFNADGTRLAARAGNGWWYLYDTFNGQKLDGGRVLTPGNTALNGPANECELTWHPTDPNKLWYTANYGSLIYYEFDITTNTSTILFDLTPLIAALGPGWSNAYRAWWRGEGRPSNDGRWWCLQVESSTYGMIGLIMYDRLNNEIVGSILTNNRPDHCSTSPLGNYGVVSWYGGTTTNLETAATQPINSANGARAYSRDFSTFTQLSVLGEHSDCALDYSGREVFVSVSYRGGIGGQEPDVNDGGIYYRDMETGVAYNLPMSAYSGSSDSAVHFSGLLNSKPGWVVVSWYGGNGEPATWKDNTISLVELVPTSPRVLRLAYHYSPYNGNYINEPHACVSNDGLRVVFASTFGGPNSEDYMIGLPSWAIPTAGMNITPTATPTITPTITPTVTQTPGPPSNTPTISITPSVTPTITITPTISPSAPPPFEAATLSAIRKGPTFTLSNNDRTATQPSSSGFLQQAGMSDNVKDANQNFSYYWEVTISDTADIPKFVGLYDTSTFDALFGSAGVVTLRGDGYLFVNNDNSYVLTNGSFTNGSTLKLLLKNGKLYIGNAVTDTWFQSGNPDAETGFIYDMRTTAYTALAPGYGTLRDNTTNTVVFAFNFGQTDFIGTVPTGATAGWPV